ncbi:hypothetical protein ZYGR_0N03690 [Zygosaccharomyces rouxii]|uniref:ZYRO0D08778p n=2 Tax=Zygosaccharomyces rouxii TaxID=4956 RepID=C5DVR3_ZYGRC|nr:mitochondrial 54S ribosomal protein IMG1 [Zygosaccharomyces rouxii]KAH9200794.1 mitochondrial 54S ribosomal protein IMG1 [Zygosaccharomyces rouxii]CAQ43287.1 54S ribosomal protein IMG1 [Zygosaccharomyces rouxii]CAQ43575.1 54S ribosomal protein IMG1 [Zygosaccharomyces rouxii]CAR27882.1 ZYRO0D08778p [Zygosaccharomyces rouxii]GAV48964.1 hypothetical protein ZYGR_0N03690 [Zygosaccharomyces rouxii]
MYSFPRLRVGLISQVRSYQIPTTTRKVIPVYPPVEQRQKPNLLQTLTDVNLKSLDPQGWKRQLVSKNSRQSLRAGDVVRVVYDQSKCSHDNFVGYVLSVNRKELVQDSSLLLRNQISKTAVEMRVPVFSPLIERIDLLKKTDGKRQRNRHYYIRGTKLDVGDLEAGLRKRK